MASVARSAEVALHKSHNLAAIETHGASPRDTKYAETVTLAIPAQKLIFIESGFKEETHIANGASLIKRFGVICRFCLNENECLLDIFGSNSCVVVMTESLVDIKIETEDMLPKQICTNCYELLNQCLAFQQQVASTDTALRRCLDQLNQLEIQNQNESSESFNPGSIEHHIFDAISTPIELSVGHKFEDVTKEDYTPDYTIVCEKNSNFYSDHDEMPIGGDECAIDYFPEVKSEPSSSDVVESLQNVKRKLVKCEQYDTELSCHSILQKHIKSHATEKPKYQCSVYSKSFSRQAGLKGHMSLHKIPNEVVEESTNVFKCANCNTSFSVERDLFIHRSKHQEDDKIRCRQYGKNSPKLTKFRFHAKKHYEDKPIECQQCGRGFTQIGEKPFVCNVCDKSFRLKCNLMHHLRVHSDEKPYKCPHCSKSFGRSSTLAIHVRTHTGEKPYKCSHCSKSFGRSSTLARHVRTHTGEKPFICNVCGKSFVHKWHLIIHLRVHTGEKPYKCSHCSKSFGRSSTLAVHVRMHTGEKPYKCSHCSKSFARSSELAIHVHTHTGEKSFICNVCDKSFMLKWSLIMHLRMHSGEKPYKCSHCAKSFSRFSTLTTHVRTHTGEKPYKCPHCLKTFRTSSALTVHVRTHIGRKP